ncbi:MAG: glycerol kinase [Alphaproteobacteria bacterium]|nr:glycerol kinase [Alphaproteobacteria bacterium]
MASASLILAIDQGTTSTRAMLFERDGRVRGQAQVELAQSYPADGWVEHDPEEIWRSTLSVARGALVLAGAGPREVAGIGLTNQRETTIVWERTTGRPIHPAIVWQDRRTAATCASLRGASAEAFVRAKTGLVLDPYFSATKIAWILDNVAGARDRAERGELAFGTVDSFLIWRLTGGTRHVTDATNASRTLLFDLVRQDWDDDLLRLFRVPRALLPEVLDCAGAFGSTAALGAPLAIAGVAGDQQAAAIGQACVAPGMVKSTYGTGCFVLMNTGATIRESPHKLLTTLAYRLDGRPAFALEGSIFIAGAAVQWLRDGLGIIASAGETETLAATGRPGVTMVPAFVGLGAPFWDADARGAIYGLTRDTGPAEIARAALEAVCFQTRDLVDAMAADGGGPVTAMRVDGGMTANRWMLQFLADITGIPIDRPRLAETTGFGAAVLAGIGTGLVAGLGDLARDWRAEERFEPRMAEAERGRRYARWRDAVARTLSRGP